MIRCHFYHPSVVSSTTSHSANESMLVLMVGRWYNIKSPKTAALPFYVFKALQMKNIMMFGFIVGGWDSRLRLISLTSSQKALCKLLNNPWPGPVPGILTYPCHPRVGCYKYLARLEIKFEIKCSNIIKSCCLTERILMSITLVALKIWPSFPAFSVSSDNLCLKQVEQRERLFTSSLIPINFPKMLARSTSEKAGQPENSEK